MKKFFRAQSTLEFIMILILVLAGILVMGPYVIRSVNAYMRSWEISAEQTKHNPNVALLPQDLDPNISPPETCEDVVCSDYSYDSCPTGGLQCCLKYYWLDGYYCTPTNQACISNPPPADYAGCGYENAPPGVCYCGDPNCSSHQVNCPGG